MIQIAQTAQYIQKRLSEIDSIKFKIFVRINFTIDVFIFSDLDVTPDDYYKKLKLPSKEHNMHSCPVNIKVQPLDEADDPFNAIIFANGENNIDWGPRYRFESLLKEGKSVNERLLKNALDEIATLNMKIVTFYSYKGGVGRTTTTMAYAIDLAVNQNKRVVITDCDLEAPGYLNFFDFSKHKGLLSGKKNGLVEFLSDIQFDKSSNGLDSINIDNYMINVSNENEDNRAAYNNLYNIYVIPAGNLNEDYNSSESSENRQNYLEGLSRLNLANVQTVVDGFKILFNKLKPIKPDVILIDSRTGFNDIFGTVALYLSNYVVGFFGYNRQTQPGLINLLQEYYSSTKSFNLALVNSILPTSADGKWMEDRRAELMSHINFVSYGKENEKNTPQIIELHRNPIFEQIGSGDNRKDDEFISIVKKRKFKDYNTLFDLLNTALFPMGESEPTCDDKTDIQLRSIVLKQLKETLKNATNFAEDAEIDEKQFYYRDCMKQLFLKDKFLIQGYKGTGKTYLYRALRDDTISKNIRNLAINDGLRIGPLQDGRCKFLNVLPERGGYNFDDISYNSIEEPEYYFNCFWRVHTWNAIFSDKEFEHILAESTLKDYVCRDLSDLEAADRLNQIVAKGMDTLIAIQKDLKRLNSYLMDNNIHLFVMYDRLDTCINPVRWSMAVSPLINFWREYWDKYSNIIPKIFVRTDLYQQILGTNTARLEGNKISIEWSLGEIFAYFFKLVFSDKDSANAFWAFAERKGVPNDYINKINKQLNNNLKQFKSIDKASIDPILNTFFGKKVLQRKYGKITELGSPWDYFTKELANADRISYSVRPFINTINGKKADNILDKTAIEEALSKTSSNITEFISPEIYASRKRRIHTAETYFADLSRDRFSEDLVTFKDFINSDEGEEYRFKSLKEKQFEGLINAVYSRLKNNNVIKTTGDLKTMIFANGIMAQTISPGGKYYRFAAIYWYAWALSNSEFEKPNPSQRMSTKGKLSLYKETGLKGTYDKLHNSVVTDGFYYKAEAFLDTDIYDGADVIFDIKLTPKPGHPNFKSAINIRFDE